MCSSVTLLRSVSCSVKENNMMESGRDSATFVRHVCKVRLEEHHERMFTESKIAMVMSSRKNGRGCLA